MADLELEYRLDGDVAEVAVSGEIDVATAPQLREMLHGLVHGGARCIVLDCRSLEFLDSSGIGLLAATRKRLGVGGELVVASPPIHVRKVLELTGVADELVLTP